jgi:DNA-binding transcriptional ArsR family regulator
VISESDEAFFPIHCEFCALMSSVIRMKVFWLLREREATVSDLAEQVGTSIQNLSQHLRLMRDKGAVETRKQGKQVYYRIANRKFVEGAMLIREGLVDELRKKSRKIGPTRS